jgi:hypothetical protein
MNQHAYDLVRQIEEVPVEDFRRIAAFGVTP